MSGGSVLGEITAVQGRQLDFPVWRTESLNTSKMITTWSGKGRREEEFTDDLEIIVFGSLQAMVLDVFQ